MSSKPQVKQWRRLQLRVDLPTTHSQQEDHHLPDPLAELDTLLFDLGAVSVTLLDAADQPIHEPDPGAQPLWPKLVVEALFDSDQTLGPLIQALEKGGWLNHPDEARWDTLEDREWVRAWMDRFEPMCFGQHLWVCPSHIAPDPSWPVVIHLDPGLAFGSGTHPTTAMCLSWLDGWCADPENQDDLTTVIDFGCGSGILGIAAACLGADKVVAVDHDPQALQATLMNAEANGCSDIIEVLSPEAFFGKTDPAPVPLVLANILAQPLIDLAPKLISLVEPGGHLVLSGILKNQAKAVAFAYQAMDSAPKITELGDWVCLAFAQKPSSHYN